MEEFQHPPHRSLLDQRVELISSRCYFVLERQDISPKKIRSFVRTMAKWFWSEKVAPKVSDSTQGFSAPYTRPATKTIWDERFDLATSIANQPVTKEFLELIGNKKELSNHRFYGYVAALALLEIMQGLMGTKPQDFNSFKNFGGPHEEGGVDSTILELEEESNTMIENLLGKAEEFVFKSDAFEEAAKRGSKGAPPIDHRWEQPVLEYLLKHKDKVEEFRKPSGKINRNGLAKHLVEELQAKHGFKLPKSDRTIADRLKTILLDARILETRG